MKHILFVLSLVVSLHSVALEPDWSEGYIVPPGGRNNPYNLSPSEFEASRMRGRLAAVTYPVSVTGILLPFRPIYNFMQNPSPNPLMDILQMLFKSVTEITSFNSFLAWTGLHEFPKEDATGIYQVPYPDSRRPDYLMGLGLIERNGVKGFTVGCAECHSSNLFGKTVLGLTNRFPRANRLFAKARELSNFTNPAIFQYSLGATDEETAMMSATLKNIHALENKVPQQLGLDTSLAAVALALDRRDEGPWAEKNLYFEDHPRPDLLDTQIADSKPAVWWNLKYKNRWLSDGSVVSGNPIFTNLLWNEIGRGVDLHALNKWLNENSLLVQDIATAVFSTEAPRITDFFDVSKINVVSAQRGEVLFNQTCKKCHGQYEKDWNTLKTLRITYHARTPVKNVGTDSNRFIGMKSLEKLNALQISKDNNTVIRAQDGYVPPPLEGIWARWPYLHNGSIPSLCALLTPGPKRPKIFYAREANDPSRDFDFTCNGYPEKHSLTAHEKLYQYDTSRTGLSNLGHDDEILLDDNGEEKFSAQDKKDLIQYLQTL